MSEIILYQLPGVPVSIVMPCLCNLSIIEIGRKDVPSGVPFWVVDESYLPKDRSNRNAWLLDTDSMGEPDGFGEA